MLECVEKNQEKILTAVATQIEEVRRSKRRTTPLAVDNATSVLVNRRRGGKKPPDDSDGGSSGPPPHRSECCEPLKHDEGEDSPPRRSRPKEGEYSLERCHMNCQKGPFTMKIAEYSVPRTFAKPPKLSMTAQHIQTRTWNTWTLFSITTARVARLSANYSC